MENNDVKEMKIPLKEHYGNYMLPIRDALEVFSGKWKIPIITALNFYESCGFKELERIVEGITPKMLSKELKFLEENLLIKRSVIDSRPVTVEYTFVYREDAYKDLKVVLHHSSLPYSPKTPS